MKTQEEYTMTEQAAQWYIALREAGPRERAAFAAWLKESPRHIEEFLEITAVDRAYDGFDPQRLVPIELGCADPTVVRLDARHAREFSSPLRSRAFFLPRLIAGRSV